MAESDDKPTAGAGLYPVGVIADLFDLTPRRVQQLATAGVLPKTDRGMYPLGACVKAYIRHLKSSEDIGADKEARQDRRETARTKRELAQMALQRATGKLVDVERLERAIFERAQRIKNLVLQAPAGIASRGAQALGVPMPRLLVFLENEMHDLAVQIAAASAGASPTPAAQQLPLGIVPSDDPDRPATIGPELEAL